METDDYNVNSENGEARGRVSMAVPGGMIDDNIQMQCKLCLTSTVISVYKTSVSNLQKTH